MTPDEFNKMLKNLRKGESVVCPICKSGKMQPVGDYKSTKCFFCSNCKKKLNLD